MLHAGRILAVIAAAGIMHDHKLPLIIGIFQCLHSAEKLRKFQIMSIFAGHLTGIAADAACLVVYKTIGCHK
jgi:hypothetical protein